jgi:hypothetical protein
MSDCRREAGIFSTSQARGVHAVSTNALSRCLDFSHDLERLHVEAA